MSAVLESLATVSVRRLTQPGCACSPRLTRPCGVTVSARSGVIDGTIGACPLHKEFRYVPGQSLCRPIA